MMPKLTVWRVIGEIAVFIVIVGFVVLLARSFTRDSISGEEAACYASGGKYVGGECKK